MEQASTIQIDAINEAVLPPLPAVALRVATLLQSDNSSPRLIGDAIGADPALATRLLRAANSPLYGLTQSVTSLPNAVMLLGEQTIYRMVMIFATADILKSNDSRSPLEHMLWNHAVAVSLAAREICLALGLPGHDEAFLCGLLHDLGKTLMLRHDLERYELVAERLDESELLGCERDSFGYTHAQLGALVARRWGLPEEISYAICHHHQPGEAPQSILLARVVDIADNLANAAGHGIRVSGDFDPAWHESALALELTPEQLTEIWQRTELALTDMMSLFPN